MQNALKDGRMKFVVNEMPLLEEEVDPKVEKTLIFELVDVLMVDITDDIDTKEVGDNYKDR